MACIANMVNETGQVIGIEHIPELVTLSVNNLNADKPDYLKSNRVKIVGEHFNVVASFIVIEKYQISQKNISIYSLVE